MKVLRSNETMGSSLTAGQHDAGRGRSIVESTVCLPKASTTSPREIGEDLQARAERSYRDAERTIEEWHDFAEGLDLAMRCMRVCRRSEVRNVVKS
jgi:hypothetical protein